MTATRIRPRQRNLSGFVPALRSTVCHEEDNDVSSSQTRQTTNTWINWTCLPSLLISVVVSVSCCTAASSSLVNSFSVSLTSQISGQSAPRTERVGRVLGYPHQHRCSLKPSLYIAFPVCRMDYGGLWYSQCSH